MITNQFLKIWLLSVNIINFKEILLIFFILSYSRINEVRLPNSYLALNVNMPIIRAIIQDNTFFRHPIWNHIMNISKVKHDKCD